LESNSLPPITPLGSVGKFADELTFPRLVPHPATGPAVGRTPSSLIAERGDGGFRGGSVEGGGDALGLDGGGPDGGGPDGDGPGLCGDKLWRCWLGGGARCAVGGRTWRGAGGGAGDRSAAIAGVPSAAMTAAASAPLIVRLSDNLAPGSSRTKGEIIFTQDRAAAAYGLEPTTKRSRAASSGQWATSRRPAFPTTGKLASQSPCPVPRSAPPCGQSQDGRKSLTAEPRTREQITALGGLYGEGNGQGGWRL
jgi:hypothetical protein